MALKLLDVTLLLLLTVITLRSVCSISSSLQADSSEVGLLKVMIHHIDMRVKQLELATGSKSKRKVQIARSSISKILIRTKAS